MKRILLNILFFIFANSLLAQTQIGATIIGGTNDDALGQSVSVSSNGSRIAMGSPYNTISSINGYARAYQKSVSGTAWNQIGTNITGEASQDNFGKVSISGDGSRLIVGGSTNDGNGANSGHVRMFEYIGTSWVQMGIDINGEAAGDGFGVNVAMSNDGSVIAIGAHLNDGNGTDAGHVRVYAWNGTAWTQRGADLNGEAAGDQFGVAVSLSPDGTQLAVGGRFNDASGVDAGHVRVFSWNGSTWTQRGVDINGEAAGDYFGNAVSVSNGGLKVAIGAPNADAPSKANCGHVRVYTFGTSWTQQGADVEGVAAGDGFGFSVSMKGTGDAFIAGSPYDDIGADANRGSASYYRYASSTWSLVGTIINSTNLPNEQFGYAVSMSNDGNTVAVGAPFNTGKGYVNVYDYTAALTNSDFRLNNNFKISPNPTQNQFQIETEVVVDNVEVANLQGQVIKTFSNQESYDISDLSAGMYLLIIHAENTKGIKKIIKE